MQLASMSLALKERVNAYVPNIPLLSYLDEQTQRQLIYNWRKAIIAKLDGMFSLFLRNNITIYDYTEVFNEIQKIVE